MYSLFGSDFRTKSKQEEIDVAKKIRVKRSKMLQAVVYNSGSIAIIWPNEDPDLVIDQEMIDVKRVLKIPLKDADGGAGFADVAKVMEMIDDMGRTTSMREFLSHIIDHTLFTGK